MSRRGEAQTAHIVRRRSRVQPSQSCRACQRPVSRVTMAGFCIHCSAKMTGADAIAVLGAYNDAKREIRTQRGRDWE